MLRSDPSGPADPAPPSGPIPPAGPAAPSVGLPAPSAPTPPSALSHRELRDADRRANRPYPKSRLVLGWLRAAQRWRGRPGIVGKLGHLLVGGSYKAVTEGLLAIELPASTEVGPGLRLRHGMGIVVNPATRIGANVMLRQHVTLGNRRTKDDCPIIEDDVEIGAGAVVIGAVTIGRGARIGPNAVVVKDVPAGAVVYSPRSEVLIPGA